MRIRQRWWRVALRWLLPAPEMPGRLWQPRATRPRGAQPPGQSGQQTGVHPSSPAGQKRRVLLVWLLCSTGLGAGAVLFALLAWSSSGLLQRLHYGVAALSCALFSGCWGVQTLRDYRRQQRGDDGGGGNAGK